LETIKAVDNVVGVLAAGELDDASALGLPRIVLEDEDFDGADLLGHQLVLKHVLVHVEI
jgi:hypothetical protein